MNKKETQPVTYKPFATENASMEWGYKNCDKCKKGYDLKLFKYRCDYEHALDEARCIGGQITAVVARAIGMLDNEGCDLWECPGWARR